VHLLNTARYLRKKRAMLTSLFDSTARTYAAAAVFAVTALIMSLLVLAVGNYLGFVFPWFLNVLLLTSPVLAVLLVYCYNFFRPYTSRILRADSALILGILVTSVALRLWYASVATVFPDEYMDLSILASNPILDPISFLKNYVQLAGPMSYHPPLAFLLLSIGYSLYPTTLGARMIAAVVGSASVVIAYLFFRELGLGGKSRLATAVYGLTPLSLVFFSVALTDVFMSFFGLLAVLLYVRCVKLKSVKLAVISGAALGLCLLTKQGLPAVWALILLIVALLRIGSFRSNLRNLMISYGTAGAIFFGWYLINPIAFVAENWSIIQFFSNLFARPIAPAVLPPPPPEQSNIVGPVPGKTVVASPENSIFALVMPRSVRASIAPYTTILLQIPLWVTPAVVLVSLVGIIRMSRRNRLDWLFLAWLILPLLVGLAPIRDVRYLAFALPSLAYFVAKGAETRSKDLRKYVHAFLALMLIVFIVLSSTIAMQQYYGPTEGSRVILELDLDKAPILTNAPSALKYELPHAEIYFFADTLWSAFYNVTQLTTLIQNKNIRSALVIHNARGLFPQLDNRTIEFLRSFFQFRTVSGPSDFSWFELLWNPIHGLSGPFQSHNLGQSYHAMSSPAYAESLDNQVRIPFLDQQGETACAVSGLQRVSLRVETHPSTLRPFRITQSNGQC